MPRCGPGCTCKRHQIRNSGQFTKDTTEETLRKFWARIDKGSDEGDCWIWQGFVTPSGYGNYINSTFSSSRPHRIAFVLAYGPIGDGLHLDHLCRNRLCCNPDHLEAVSGVENNRRSNSPSALNKRKAECIRGHRLDGENLYVTPDGRRQCKVCRNQSTLKSRKVG